MSQWDEPGSDVRQEVLGFHVVRSMSTEVIARLHYCLLLATLSQEDELSYSRNDKLSFMTNVSSTQFNDKLLTCTCRQLNI